MDKKKERLMEKISSAIHASLENNQKDSCGLYSQEDFDLYWEGLLDYKKARELESHCFECVFCLHGLAKASAISEQAKLISERTEDSDLVNKGISLFPAGAQRKNSEYLWAATSSRSGAQGESFGIAISGEGRLATLIECNAWVGCEMHRTGKLELWGMQIEGTAPGVPVTHPLDYLEEKLEGIFRVNPVLRAFNLSKRYINVDLKERILREANSLSLGIVISILNAIHKRKEDVPRVYSADLRQDGKLERVGHVLEKVKAARERGIKSIVLSKENEPDMKELAPDPDVEILFFDNIADVLTHFGLFPAGLKADSGKKCSTSCESFSSREISADSFSESSTAKSGEWHFVLELAKDLGAEETFLLKLLTFFEDLCQARFARGEFSTVFFLGPTEKIKAVLPPSGIDFLQSQSVLCLSEHILDLIPLVNGKDFGFVLTVEGILNSIRRVNVEIAGRRDVSPLLMGANHRYACLSLFSESLVFFFSPTGRHLHVYSKGELVGKYLNGRWRPTDYRVLQTALMKVSEEDGIDIVALEKIARTAMFMAEKGQAGGFVFVPEIEDFHEQWRDHLESDMGLVWNPTNAEELTEKELITLSDEDTFVVIDKNARVIACRATLPASGHNGSTIYRENRNVELVTSLISAVAIMANSNGFTTLYRDGHQLACI